jgi:tight adherence protein B
MRMDVIVNLFGNLLAVFIVLAFIAMVLLLEGLYLTWSAYKGPEAKRINQRLRAMSAGGSPATEASIVKQRLLSEAPLLQRWLLQLPRVHELDRLLQQSGTNWTVGKLAGLSIAFAVAGFVSASFMPYLGFAFDILIAAGAAVLPSAYVLRKRQNRIRKLEEQLPDALDLMSRALRAGHALPSGLQMVGEEAQEPIAGEFRIVHDEINYGIAVQTALMNLAHRVPSTDVRYFVIAVLIQRDTGGNLTEVLGNISTLVRERLKLLGKVRVLSAEGRMSGWVLGILPFAVAGIINLLNPKFMSVLWTDPMGLKIVYTAFGMMLLAAFWMRSIIKIRV